MIIILLLLNSPVEDEFYHTLKERDHGGNHTEELHQQFRDLLEGDEIEWFNYWPMLGARTEYYYIW